MNFKMAAYSIYLAALAFICAFCIKATTAAYLDHIFDNGTNQVKREIVWKAVQEPMPVSKEKELLQKDVLIRRGEFGSLHGSRLLEVELECCELGISVSQAMSIRKQLLMGKARSNHWKLRKKKSLKNVIHSFEKEGKSLTTIAQELDLPPVSVFRAIIANRVLDRPPEIQVARRKRPSRKIIQSIIAENNSSYLDSYISKRELAEIQRAKKCDVIGHIMNSTSPQDWENDLYKFLDAHQINYIKEKDLKSLGTQSTPDCLLLDDISINGRKVRWIEFKSYYASGLKENWWFTKKLIEQSEKYKKEFRGEGAIIMKGGFSEKLTTSSTLFLDSGPLSTDFICIF